MEYNPSLTPTYLAGKVDEYVKYQARDTVTRNARRDRNCRYARIPDGRACDFCKMLGSRGFVYHSELKAGGEGNDYHPYCNCQLAVSFDPFIEKYEVVSENGTVVTVTRGYGMEDARLVQAGRDGSFELRQVDIDELYDEYKAMGRKFTAKSKLKDYTRGARLSDEAFDEAMRRLSEARTLDELHEVGKDIVDNWPKNDNGRDKRQWDEMSRLAQELEAQFAPHSTPYMAAKAPEIRWPDTAPRLKKERFDKINASYEVSGVKLHPNTLGNMVDESALVRVLDAAKNAIEKIPGLKQLGGSRPLTIVVDHQMAANDFGKLMPNKPWIIHVNAGAVRDLSSLEAEYAKAADDGWFVAGTKADAVIYHELGHALERLYNIDAKEIAKEILGAKDKDELAYGLLTNLSEYSSRNIDTEITSEVMAAWLSGTDNWFANEFMKRIVKA